MSKDQILAVAREARVRLVYWNQKSRAFKIEGAHSQLGLFRGILAQDLGGLHYIVTDDGSYPTYGVRLYTPM